MLKHTQTIPRQIADELFEFVWPFFEIGAKRVNESMPVESLQIQWLFVESFLFILLYYSSPRLELQPENLEFSKFWFQNLFKKMCYII